MIAAREHSEYQRTKLLARADALRQYYLAFLIGSVCFLVALAA